MRVFITGVAGFVGRHLVRLLVDHGHEVYGTCVTSDASHVVPNVKTFQCDLRDARNIALIISRICPERIYHLAALSSVKGSFDNQKDVYDTNFYGTLHLLEAVRTGAAQARVLNVASGQIYGPCGGSAPITEDAPLLPQSPYALSKAAADLLAYQHFCAYNLQVIRARPFNHTGPGQPVEFVCSDFARQVAEVTLNRRDPVISVGDLAVQRNFSDVRDVVRAYELLLERGRAGEAYNVCSEGSTSLKTVVRSLISFSDRKITISASTDRFRKHDVRKQRASNHKLRSSTGWKPEYTLTSTLRDLYDYWKNALEAA